jgi:hypothetical protein
MSRSYSLNQLFREFQFFSGDDSSEGFNAQRQNYAVSAYGHKIAIVDITAQKVFVVSALLNLEGGESLISRLKTLAVAGTATETTILGAIGTDKVYSFVIPLGSENFYKQAIAANPDLNSVANIQSWISLIAEASRSYATSLSLKGPHEALNAAVFSESPRVYLYSGYAGTENDDTFILTNLDVGGSPTAVDGGEGQVDSLAISDSITLSRGLWANLSDSNYSYSNGLAGPAAINVSILANSASFKTKPTTTSEVTSNFSLGGIEAISGSRWNDFLVGSGSREFFEPGQGSDVVIGSVSFSSANHTGNLATKDRVAYWDLNTVLPTGAPSGAFIKAVVSVGTGGPGPSGGPYPLITVTEQIGKAVVGTDRLFNISYVGGSNGNDTFTGLAYHSVNNPFFTEFIGMGGADTIVGNGSVRASYVLDPSGVTVNLSSSLIGTNLLYTPESSIPNGTTVSPGKVLDGFGFTDTVSNLYGIRGSDWSDFLVMGSRDEVVTAGDGDDFIFGGSGSDLVWGNLGADEIRGDSGVDILVGDNWSHIDGRVVGADRFIFTKVTDSSGSTIKTTDNRNVGDIILDFDIAGAEGDLIDLSAIDANTRLRGNQSFFVDENSLTSFSRRAGQLIFNEVDVTLTSETSDVNTTRWHGDWSRASSSTPEDTQSGYLIQGDIQGDGRADFSIFLVGVSSQDLNSLPIIF